MKKLKRKGIVALTLSFCLAAGILGGCSQKKETKPEASKGAGRYVEEDVALPLKEGEEPWYLLKRADGQLEVYTFREDGYGRYLSADGTEWQEEDASWLELEEGENISSITSGADGSDYALVMDESGKLYLRKESKERIELSALDQKEADDLEQMMLFGSHLLVMEDGSLVLLGNGEARICSPDGSRVLHSFSYEEADISTGFLADVQGGKLVLTDQSGQGFTVWDVQTEKEETSVSYGAEVRSGRVLLTENGGLYYMNAEGIHHMNPDGALVETLVEGDSTVMGNPQIYIEGFVRGSEDDFYSLFMGNQVLLKHYYFDENAGNGGERQLTIYGLKENQTVRQAMGIFRQKHPEVEISYKTGASDTAATRADQLRVLNTELLNQNGADVLLLDDLPVDSLTEKGVLADLSGILDPMISDGTLKKEIAECYRGDDGKIYAMPVRYGLPLLFGSQELLDVAESLEAMENWLETHPEKLMTGYSYKELTELFLRLYGNGLFDEEGKLSQEALSRCLSCIRKIGERYDAVMVNDYEEEMEAYGGITLGAYTLGDPEEELLFYTEIKGLFETMMPFVTIREKNYPMVYGKDSFVPHGVAGINSAAKEPELAAEFLQLLFSEEVQDYDLQDGLPMNTASQKAFIEQGCDSLEDDDSELMGGVMVVEETGDGEAEDGGNKASFTFAAPLKTELEQMFDKTSELKAPVFSDGILQEMIMEEAAGYYEGSRELEEILPGILAKVDTYRAE